jgi:quercetin dioxygenase-like cupin family protein
VPGAAHGGGTPQASWSPPRGPDLEHPHSMSDHSTSPSPPSHGLAVRHVDTAATPWRTFDEAPGVSYKTLNKTPEGSLTLLLKFEPGAEYPRHTHPAGEEYYVVSGMLDDVGRTYGPGSFVYHAPGSTHTPRSARGCEVLVFLSAPIERKG